MIKRQIGILVAALFFVVALASPGSAQIFVVQTCGTVPASMKTLVPGAPGMFFEDTTGTLCVSGGGGGGGAVTIASGADVTEGTATDSAYAGGASATVIAGLKGIYGALVAPLPAGETHIGEVGGNLLPIVNDMTTTSATVTTGQSIGGIQTLANAVRVSGSLGASGTSGYIQSLTVTFTDAVGSGPLDVYFYNATVTTGTNCQNATAFVLQNGDRDKVLGVAHVTDFTSSNTAVVAQANNLAIPFGLASSTSLFACVVARGSFVIAGTTNASLKVNVVRN